MTHVTQLRTMLCDAAIRFDETETPETTGHTTALWRTLTVHTHDGARVACIFTPAGALERLTLHGMARPHTPAVAPHYAEETLTHIHGIDGWWHATEVRYDAANHAYHCPICGALGVVDQGLFHCTGACHAIAVVADGRTFLPVRRRTEVS